MQRRRHRCSDARRGGNGGVGGDGFRKARQKSLRRRPSFRSQSSSSVALITCRRVQASLELFVPPEAEMILQLLALLILTPIALFVWHKKTKYGTIKMNAPLSDFPVKLVFKNVSAAQTSTDLPTDAAPATAPDRPPPVPHRAARQGESPHLLTADIEIRMSRRVNPFCAFLSLIIDDLDFRHPTEEPLLRGLCARSRVRRALQRRRPRPPLRPRRPHRHPRHARTRQGTLQAGGSQPQAREAAALQAPKVAPRVHHREGGHRSQFR